MTYDELVERIVFISGCPEALVRLIFDAIPSALVDMEVKDHVRTPLGVFRMVKITKKRTRLFGTEKWSPGHTRIYVRLRPGVKLYREGYRD